MIAFESPEGETLRALKPSRSATLAIWLTALKDGTDNWAEWARAAVGTGAPDAEVTALRYIQAVLDGDIAAVHQFWAVLGSFPAEAGAGSAVRAARELRATLPT
jgi:hypothetical protein